MARLLALAVLAAAPGCVVPKHQTEIRILAEQPQLVSRPLGDLQLHANVAGDQLSVTASRARVCSHDTIQTVEIHRYVSSEVRTGNNVPIDPRVVLFAAGLVAAVVVTIAVSGLVTETIIAASKDTRTRELRRVHGDDYDCSVPVATPIEVTLASGSVLHGVTDASGVYTTSLDDEYVKAIRSAEHPTVIAGLPIGSPSERRLRKQQRAFKAVRNALRACGAKYDITGVVHAQLAIDATGHVMASPDLGGEDFATCVQDGLVDVRFPHAAPMKLVFPYKLDHAAVS